MSLPETSFGFFRIFVHESWVTGNCGTDLVVGGYSSSIAPTASLINIPESKMPGAINLSGPGYPLHVYIYLG